MTTQQQYPTSITWGSALATLHWSSERTVELSSNIWNIWNVAGVENSQADFMSRKDMNTEWSLKQYVMNLVYQILTCVHQKLIKNACNISHERETKMHLPLMHLQSIEMHFSHHNMPFHLSVFYPEWWTREWKNSKDHRPYLLSSLSGQRSHGIHYPPVESETINTSPRPARTLIH